MKTLLLHAKVGEDGVLRLDVPLGVDAANQKVRITIAPVPVSRFTKEEWSKIVEENSGFWQGEFERPPQGEFEIRDPL